MDDLTAEPPAEDSPEAGPDRIGAAIPAAPPDAAPPEAVLPDPAGTRAYPRPTVDLEEAEWVWRDLASRTSREPLRHEEVRLAVIAGLARCTGARYGDLLRVQVDDVELPADSADPAASPGTVLVRHGKHRVERVHELDPGVVVVLRRWADVRAELCAELEGSPPRALLLTVHHTHADGVTVSKGLPITAQGLVLSWRRYVHRTAAEQAGRRRPLPTRFEQVRRAWVVAAQPEPEGVRPAGRR